MSIALVVTRGFGSFGSVNKLPTLGYSTPFVNLTEIGYTLRTDPAHYTVAKSQMHYTARAKQIGFTVKGNNG